MNFLKNKKKEDRFKIKLYGLSEDMEDFMLERLDYYSEHKAKFWSSFWKICVDIWSNGMDLSDKQLNIIYREYKKIEINSR